MNETNDEEDLKMTREKQGLESSSSTAREKIIKEKRRRRKMKMKRRDNDERKWKNEASRCGQINVLGGVKE